MSQKIIWLSFNIVVRKSWIPRSSQILDDILGCHDSGKMSYKICKQNNKLYVEIQWQSIRSVRFS